MLDGENKFVTGNGPAVGKLTLILAKLNEFLNFASAGKEVANAGSLPAEPKTHHQFDCRLQINL